MTTLAALLQAIPAVVWSGLLASLFTLSGVFISNFGNNNRLKIQLKHDADENAKERTATLRREVYLRTAEELVRANAHLAGLPHLDITKTNLAEGLLGFSAAAARLQLVAEPQTAILVNQLQGEYGELVIDLMANLMPAAQAKADIQLADDMYSKAQLEIARLLAEMSKQNESGNPDQRVFEALQSALRFQQSQSSHFADERASGWANFNEYNVAYQRALIAKLREIGIKQIPVLIAIRRDLGLNSNLEEMEAQMRAQMARMEEKLNAFLGSLKAA